MFSPDRSSQRWGANYFTAVVSAFLMSTKQNELIPWHVCWLIFKQLTPVQGITNTRGKTLCKGIVDPLHCLNILKMWLRQSVNWRWMLNNAKAEGKESIVRVYCYSPRAPSINPDDRLLKSLKNNRRAGTESLTQRHHTKEWEVTSNNVSLGHFGVKSKNTTGTLQGRFRDQCLTWPGPFGL